LVRVKPQIARVEAYRPIWEHLTNNQSRFIYSVTTMPAPSTVEERLIALAMGILGRRGGRARSTKKTKAVRENGKKGGAPKGNTNRLGKLKAGK
jgi:hypothetical protein